MQLSSSFDQVDEQMKARDAALEETRAEARREVAGDQGHGDLQ